MSVIIPVRDREQLLPRAMASVLGQTHGDLELLVVDDHSVDGTVAAASQAGDGRVRVLRVWRGRGAQAARNTGLRAARGRTVAFLDSDDEWRPQLLDRCLSRLERTGEQVAYTEGRIAYDQTGLQEPTLGVARLEGDAYGTLLRRPPGPVFSSLVARREALLSIGGLDEELVAFQEWDTCLRLAERHGRFALVDEDLWTWHRHGAGTISGDGLRNAGGYAQVVCKHRHAMLAHGGHALLAEHYGQLAQLYRRLGHTRMVWRHVAQAAACAVRSRAWWTNAGECLVGRLGTADEGRRVQERRVYG